MGWFIHRQVCQWVGRWVDGWVLDKCVGCVDRCADEERAEWEMDGRVDTRMCGWFVGRLVCRCVGKWRVSV